jgi:hypothetical protein
MLSMSIAFCVQRSVAAVAFSPCAADAAAASATKGS